jgi:hypothetical protein
MFDSRNLPDFRPGYGFKSSATCPYALGDTGYWYDGASVKLRNVDGTDATVASAPASYGPVRLVDTSVLVSSAYDYDATALTWTQKTNNTQATIDSVAPALNDRVLRVVGDAKDGIYAYSRLKASSVKAQWTRVADLNESGDFVNGAVVAVTAGTAYANTLWELSFTAPFTLDTTTPTFAQTATAVTAGAIRAAISATQATAPTSIVDFATPVFSGTGQSSSGQVITTTDNQTMTLNQCAGMWFVSATHGPYLIASNTAVAGAPAVLTIYGTAPTTDAGTYKIVRGLVASHTHSL